MITGMSSEYERLKRWREKHRGLVNLRQQQYRKEKKEGDNTCPAILNEKSKILTQGNFGTTVQPAAPTDKKQPKIEQLRALLAAESAKPPVPICPEPAKPRIYKDKFGNILTKAQHDEWLTKLEAAKGKYEIDEYSQ